MSCDRECCGTCQYPRYDRNYESWVCGNEVSDNYGLDTNYNDCCEDYEERE